MKRDFVRQVIFPLLAAMIWGMAFVAQSVVSDTLEPFTVNAARFLIAAVGCVAVIALKYVFSGKRSGRSAEYRRELLTGGLLCGLALTVASNLQQAGIAETSAGKAGFITALYIVLVPLLGTLAGKKSSPLVWVGVAVAACGLWLLCVDGDFRLAAGDVYLLLCALVFSAHILIISRYSPRVDAVELSLVQFIVAGVSSLALALIFEEPTFAAVLDSAVPLLYVGIFSSCVAYTLQIEAQKTGDPTVVSLLLSLESAFAAIAGALVLHDRMSPREYLGCALMLAAIVLAELPAPKKRPVAEKA